VFAPVLVLEGTVMNLFCLRERKGQFRLCPLLRVPAFTDRRGCSNREE